MPTASELYLREVEQKRAELKRLFDQARTGSVDPDTGAPIFDMEQTVVEEVQRRETELAQMEAKYQAQRMGEIYSRNDEEMRQLRQTQRTIAPALDGGRGGGGLGAEFRGVSLAERIAESVEYKTRNRQRGRFSVTLDDFDTKALMTTTGGFEPPNPRTDKIVLSAQRRPVVADVVPQDTTTLDVIKWMEETTFSDNAATVSEGDSKPEAILDYAERSATVETISVWLPVTTQQIDDVPQLRNLIDNRLTLMLLLEEEDQLLLGNGTSPNLRGFLNASGLQTQAYTTNAADTIFNAFTKVRWTGMAEPSAVIINPTDWAVIRLMKSSDPAGIYVWGPPNTPGFDTIWGKPVVVTPAVTTARTLVGDFTMYSHISRRLGITIDVSDSHSDYFIKNKLAIRAEERLSLEIYRGAAFCEADTIA